MRIRNLFPISIIAILPFIVCCKDSDLDDTQIVFHVIIDKIEAYSATAIITHNGSNRDTYYGFIVEGKVDNPMAEISHLLSSPKAKNVLDAPLSQRKRVQKINGLSPKRTFSYVVFGRNDDGDIYGEPAVIEFTTIGSSITADENLNWKVSNKGHVVYSDYDYTLINVHVEGKAEERFFLGVYDKALPSMFNTTEDFIVNAVNEFTRLQNSIGDDDFWLDASKIRTESTNFYRHLTSGDYIAYAIGLNADGTPTGHYAKSETFHVDKYPYVESYANLLGNSWYFVDSNEKYYFVEFKERLVNRTLTMIGWGNYNEFEILVQYDRNNGNLKISSQQITSDDVTINFIDGNETGTVFLTGGYYNAEDKLKWTSKSGLSLARGKAQGLNAYDFTSGYNVTLDDGTLATKLGMTFVLKQNGSYKVGFARMMFPFTLNKLEEE